MKMKMIFKMTTAGFLLVTALATFVLALSGEFNMLAAFALAAIGISAFVLGTTLADSWLLSTDDVMWGLGLNATLLATGALAFVYAGVGVPAESYHEAVSLLAGFSAILWVTTLSIYTMVVRKNYSTQNG
jgi:hypothetical protein